MWSRFEPTTRNARYWAFLMIWVIPAPRRGRCPPRTRRLNSLVKFMWFLSTGTCRRRSVPGRRARFEPLVLGEPDDNSDERSRAREKCVDSPLDALCDGLDEECGTVASSFKSEEKFCSHERRRRARLAGGAERSARRFLFVSEGAPPPPQRVFLPPAGSPPASSATAVKRQKRKNSSHATARLQNKSIPLPVGGKW